MPRSIGHPRACGCVKCVKRREQTRVNVENYRARKRTENGLPPKIRARVQSGKLEDKAFFKRYLDRHPQMAGLTAGDILAQMGRQSKKCLFTGVNVRLQSTMHQESVVVLKNDPLGGWSHDNIRLVSMYATRYIMDPAWGGTLDAFKEQQGKGLDT